MDLPPTFLFSPIFNMLTHLGEGRSRLPSLSANVSANYHWILVFLTSQPLELLGVFDPGDEWGSDAPWAPRGPTARLIAPTS